MTKINLNRIFEIGKYLETKSGDELKDALQYLSQFAEVALRALSGGPGSLTYLDNFDCETKRVDLLNGIETVVLTKPVRRVVEVRIRQVINDTFYIVDKFGWKYNGSGNIVTSVYFSGSPGATQNITVELLIFYG